MNKEKIKQIILIILAFTFIGIGSINFYNQYKSVEVASDNLKNELSLGDVQLVNSEISNRNEENTYLSEIVSNDELKELENKTEVNNITSNSTSDENLKTESNYFVETRLERDKMYSEMLETYKKMLENNEIAETQKVIASQEISNINNSKNGIMISENLIKNKGFEDVVIMVNNGSVSVVVKSSLLTKEQIAQIQNIVSRELNVGIENIYISKK